MKQVFPMDSRVTYDAEGRPSYDRAVSSKPLRSLIRKLFTTGVMPNPSNTCQVRAGGDGMTLIVSPGLAVLEGGLYLEDAARTLSVTAADPTFDRIDTVVLRWNENDAVRDCDLHVVAGVPAKNPVRPALTREGSIYEIGLADIFVTKGVATITNEKITDTRMESARCGIVSSVSKWDTTTIYQQIQSDLAGFKSNEQAEFMNWFDKMKDQLTEDAAGRLQTEIDDVTSKLQNLQIGGRNYVVGSNAKASSDSAPYVLLSIDDINNFNQNLGKPITLSIRYTAKNWTGRRFGFEMAFIYEDGTALYPNVWIDGSVDGNKTQSATYILPIEHGKIKSIEQCGIHVQGTTAGTATVYQPKLELGNIATDWTPAPEDLIDTSITNSDIDTILNS